MKIGRNDPCPCGSGRKYKHCCLGKSKPPRFETSYEPSRDKSPGSEPSAEQLSRRDMTRLMLESTGFDDSAELETAMSRYENYCNSLPDGEVAPTFMEFLGQPNAATQTQKKFIEAVVDHAFEDADELEAFAHRFTEEEASASLSDFESLSPRQIHQILSDKMADSELFDIDRDLSDQSALKAELIGVMHWLLGYFAARRGEVKITGTGRYNRQLCEAYCKRYPAWFGENRSIPQESSLFVLETTHELMRCLAYTEFAGNKEWLTTEGVDIYSRKRWSQMYLESIEFVIDFFDWKHWLHQSLRAGHFNLVQNAAIFLLYLLRNQPAGSIGAFIDRVFRAFPEYIRPAQGQQAATDLIARATLELFFGNFCPLFGLVEIDGDPTSFPESRSTEYRVTPLFTSLFQWKV